LGGVKVDGTTINIASGVISVPTASTSVAGIVKVDGTTISITGGVITAASYLLPTASTSTLGGVKVDGTTITISNGVISSTGGGGGTLSSRTTVATTTASLTVGASTTATVTAAKGYALYSIACTSGAWVVVYSSSPAQTNDSSRAITTDPTPGSGVIAESITTGNTSTTTYFTPAVMGFNNDGTPSTNMYLKIYNNGGVTGAITVTITYLKLEA
jgi:hypothetical protein